LNREQGSQNTAKVETANNFRGSEERDVSLVVGGRLVVVRGQLSDP
jgi:hypothetical protein